MRKVADDLSLNGTASQYYEQFHRNLDNAQTPMASDGKVNDSKGSFTYGDTGTVTFRLIGINHDIKADGTGKAGLSFMTVDSTAIPRHRMSVTNQYPGTNSGGWRDSQLRRDLNEGDIWTSLPESLKTNLTPVVKSTNDEGYNAATVSGTTDRMWLLSYMELVETPYIGWSSTRNWHTWTQSGSQYEFFTHKVTNNYSSNPVLNSTNIPAADGWRWLRSAGPGNPTHFGGLYPSGGPSYTNYAHGSNAVAPGFAF